jgi:hypothetical protein
MSWILLIFKSRWDCVCCTEYIEKSSTKSCPAIPIHSCMLNLHKTIYGIFRVIYNPFHNFLCIYFCIFTTISRATYTKSFQIQHKYSSNFTHEIFATLHVIGPILSKLNKLKKTSLVIVCTTIWNASFIIFFFLKIVVFWWPRLTAECESSKIYS